MQIFEDLLKAAELSQRILRHTEDCYEYMVHCDTYARIAHASNKSNKMAFLFMEPLVTDAPGRTLGMTPTTLNPKPNPRA